MQIKYGLISLVVILMSLLPQNALNQAIKSGIDDSFFINKIEINKKDTLKTREWGKKWELYAKKRGNTIQIIEAKKATLYYHNPNEWLTIAEEIKAWAIASKDEKLIIEAYTRLASTAYACNKIKEACNYFIKADQLLQNSNDEYNKCKVRFGIALCKYYLGYYNEALALTNNCISYFEIYNDRGYINSLHLKANCLIKLKQYKECQYLIELGLQKSKELEILEMEKYFWLVEGMNLFHRNKYKKAENILKNVEIKFKTVADDNAKDLINFYLGQIEWNQNNKQSAVNHFNNIVNRYHKTKKIKADQRKSIELLINYYKEINNTKKELETVNLLLEIDKKNTADYKYLVSKIIKEYDTKELINTKVELESKIQTQNLLLYTGIFIIITVTTLVLIRRKKSKKIQKQTEIREKSNKPIRLKPELEEQLLKNLERFERTKKYLEKEMTLNKMAAILNSNTKYVTKIIAKHRGKGTIEYLSDLKIEYIVERLQNEKKFRLYTNKALGEEIGFGSTQNFTKAFKSRMNMTPTEYIQKLNE